MMRAAVLESIGSPVVLKDIPEPQPQAGDAVLTVLSTPILAYAKHIFSGQLAYPSLVPLVPGTSPCLSAKSPVRVALTLYRRFVYCTSGLPWTRNGISQKGTTSLLRYNGPSKR
jgi:hypothetical protein